THRLCQLCVHRSSSIVYSSFLFSCSAPLPHLHSFPTRRSSDLALDRHSGIFPGDDLCDELWFPDLLGLLLRCDRRCRSRRPRRRSEEHTSELQSLRHLVCRLLLEKKKKEKNI